MITQEFDKALTDYKSADAAYSGAPHDISSDEEQALYDSRDVAAEAVMHAPCLEPHHLQEKIALFKRHHLNVDLDQGSAGAIRWLGAIEADALDFAEEAKAKAHEERAQRKLRSELRKIGEDIIREAQDAHDKLPSERTEAEAKLVKDLPFFKRKQRAVS